MHNRSTCCRLYIEPVILCSRDCVARIAASAIAMIQVSHDAEVCELDVSQAVDEHIVRLDISMHVPLLV